MGFNRFKIRVRHGIGLVPSARQQALGHEFTVDPSTVHNYVELEELGQQYGNFFQPPRMISRTVAGGAGNGTCRYDLGFVSLNCGEGGRTRARQADQAGNGPRGLDL